MQLPLKFRPRISQLIGEVIGAAIIIGFGAVFLAQYASPDQLRQYKTIGAWLGSDPLQLPFLLASIALLLVGLGWFTITLIDLLADSPFNYFIVDREGITHRNFWGERRYPWSDLGPIQAERLSAWAGRGSQRRHWITADNAGGKNLRIPATVYLGGSLWVGGGITLATQDAAGWLEELRQLAKIGRLEPGEMPDPPSDFRRPIELQDRTTAQASAAPAANMVER